MRIFCAVCEREVDKVVVERYDWHNHTTLTVYCHGAVDECAITDQFIAEAGPEFARNPQGVAFATQYTTIENPVRALAHVREARSEDGGTEKIGRIHPEHLRCGSCTYSESCSECPQHRRV